MNLRNTSAAMLAAATVATGAATAAQIAHDGNAQVVMQEGRTVLIYSTNGAFTVTSPGTVELLAVGGGGGGGGKDTGNDGRRGCGGGGGGIYTNSSFDVVAGTYSIAVGGGGGTADDKSGDNGGDTTLSLGGVALVTAKGGGGGGRGGGYAGKDGASGGGSSREWMATALKNPGSAIYTNAPYWNLGNSGGQGDGPYTPGGGGGAGEAGGNSIGNDPGKGGDGVEVPIVASGIWYGGGGAGYRINKTVAGGNGGGGKLVGGTGFPGEDGKGGGGCGGQRGGSGALILAFTPSATVESGFFEGVGGDDVFKVKTATGKDEVRVFQQSGTLTLTGRGTVEVLAVGGGGGGGTLNGEIGAGGGGAGGFVHYTNLVVSAGTYQIEIGEGGAVGKNGGITRGLGVVAYGGGAGANAGSKTGGKDGASGGGASHSFSSINTTTNAGGRATMSAYANSGHDGYQSAHPYLPGGGGGAGGMGAAPWGSHPGSGGNGLSCSITGSAVWYAGGGAGYRTGAAVASPGGQGGGGSLGDNGVTHPGESNTGGGGCGGSAGGSGVFIVRYHLKPLATVLILK